MIRILLLLVLARVAIAQPNEQLEALRHTRCYSAVPIREFYGVAGKVLTDSGEFAATAPAVFDGRAYAATNNGSVLVVDDDHLLGSYRIKGATKAAPAVSERFVIIGSDAKFVEAFDRVSHKRLWHFRTKSAIIASSIIVSNHIYVPSTDGTLYALDTLGKQKWKYRIDGAAQSPSYDDSVIYLGSAAGHCAALNAATGKMIWASDLGGHSLSVSSEAVYTVNRNGAVVALDKVTGNERRRFDVGASNSAFDIAVSDSALAYAVGSTMVVYDPTTGKERWQHDFARPICGAPIIIGNIVYVPNSDWNLHGFDATTGTEICTSDIGFAPWGSPSFGGGRIFCPNRRTMFILKAAP